MKRVDYAADRSWVWVDVCSVSQRHQGLQQLAIKTLPIYSALCSAFVIVTPNATHHDTGDVCDLDSYTKRGWCRAEMFSKLSMRGTDHMYKICSENGNLEEVKDMVSLASGFDDLFNVFAGDFSCCARKHRHHTSPMHAETITSLNCNFCCMAIISADSTFASYEHAGNHVDSSVCDKVQLVAPMLGVYHRMLSQGSKHTNNILAKMNDLTTEHLFPTQYEYAALLPLALFVQLL